MTDLSDERTNYTKYRWEFMRRNDEYIEDYQKTIDREIAVCTDQDSGTPEFRPTKEYTKFCRKWGIKVPISPDRSYDDLVKEFELVQKEHGLPALGFDIHELWHQWVKPADPFSGRAVAVKDGWEYEQDGDDWRRSVPDRVAMTGVISIQIDLNYSKKTLLKEVKGLVDEWKDNYEDAYRKLLLREFCDERGAEDFPPNGELMQEFEKIHKERLKQRKDRYKQKLHSSNFDLYLQVWDLKEKEELSWADITNELGLRDLINARNHYNSAKKLIEKGIDLYIEQIACPSKQG